jgi:hypothetical protein
VEDVKLTPARCFTNIVYKKLAVFSFLAFFLDENEGEDELQPS